MIWWIPTAVANPGVLSAEPEFDPAPAPETILGGEVVTPGERPAIGALFVRDLFGCTSVLIAPDLVLSAGHCDTAGSIERSVVLGATDLTMLEDAERIAIAESWRYPDYLETFDIALFALDAPAVTEPARVLWPCEVDELLFDGIEAQIAGYGATDRSGVQTTTLLHDATVTIQDADCSDLKRGCRAAVSPGGELRAGTAPDAPLADTCIGDSGGPLTIDSPDGPLVAGITSRSALPAPTPCGEGGLYVRTDALIDWIEATSGRALPRPDCAPPGPVNEPEPEPKPKPGPLPEDTGRPLAMPGSSSQTCRHAGSGAIGAWLGLLGISAVRRRRRLY
ncbi:MAG: serine protease [Myxococcota bacterium]